MIRNSIALFIVLVVLVAYKFDISVIAFMALGIVVAKALKFTYRKRTG